MTYRVEFTGAAARQIKKLPRAAQTRILEVIVGLEGEPRPRGSRKLAGEETAWRIRVGDYRVIYDALDSTLTAIVVRAAHRREVYGG